ncbi:MAG TPA: GNAT family N-acetyltransferase [Burkholderiales bacterium]|nr:GNAT family N-acetyltransferase [Burkholderiales bacterium]
MIGMAQYADAGEGSEIAVAVADAWQRQRLVYHLLDALLNVAAEAGIERIHADVLADNHAMRRLAHKLGFEMAGNPAAPFLVKVTKNLPAQAAAHPRALASRLFHPARAVARPYELPSA